MCSWRGMVIVGVHSISSKNKISWWLFSMKVMKFAIFLSVYRIVLPYRAILLFLKNPGLALLGVAVKPKTAKHLLLTVYFWKTWFCSRSASIIYDFVLCWKIGKLFLWRVAFFIYSCVPWVKWGAVPFKSLALKFWAWPSFVISMFSFLLFVGWGLVLIINVDTKMSFMYNRRLVHLCSCNH